jgi:hypothetical protein
MLPLLAFSDTAEALVIGTTAAAFLPSLAIAQAAPALPPCEQPVAVWRRTFPIGCTELAMGARILDRDPIPACMHHLVNKNFKVAIFFKKNHLSATPRTYRKKPRPQRGNQPFSVLRSAGAAQPLSVSGGLPASRIH